MGSSTVGVGEGGFARSRGGAGTPPYTHSPTGALAASRETLTAELAERSGVVAADCYERAEKGWPSLAEVDAPLELGIEGGGEAAQRLLLQR